MAGLPFVVQPRRAPILERVGSDDSGILEVERRGYLSVGEKSFVQQVQQYDNGTTEIVTLSRRVARKYSLGMDRAYGLVLNVIGGTAIKEEDAELVSEIEREFAEEMAAVVRGLAAGQSKEELIQAACLMKYRVDPEFDIADVSRLHPDIVSGLSSLYKDEERRCLDAFKAEEEASEGVSVEELEKKPVKARRSRSKPTTGD